MDKKTLLKALAERKNAEYKSAVLQARRTIEGIISALKKDKTLPQETASLDIISLLANEVFFDQLGMYPSVLKELQNNPPTITTETYQITLVL